MLIFVYGTLKRGGSNHALLAAQRFVGVARTAPGFTLYSLGHYPGMIAEANDTAGVTGEIWKVDAAALAALDALEGLAEGLYTRGPVPLVDPFAQSAVETYYYARPTAGYPRLGSLWTE
jgi:gamma-glutamylcyclotransferase (GGCT)/AIG2-like uncharacterized protein YtfP